MSNGCSGCSAMPDSRSPARPEPLNGRACSFPPGDLLPLSFEDFRELQNWTLRERERCVGCGLPGVYWYGHGWLCEDCDRA